MSVAQRQPVQSQPLSVSAGLSVPELREQLSAAIERFDHHKQEAEDLGRLNKTGEALAHLQLANEAAADAERIADRITALGPERPGVIARRNRGSDWMVER